MKPPYFDAVQGEARRRWDQLEADPDLAGPWHQLFEQVQSPHHVVSELLQNADDAGASEAAVMLEDGHFVFSHNGEDFTEEQFRSLCRFGYSNKRNLHTIGFRGVGFKSTFSLGDMVRVASPSLSVAFHKRRFTEPLWEQSPDGQSDWTEIRVELRDENRRADLGQNLQDWLSSPASLLFFRSIRRLRVGDREISWVAEGEGHSADSEWVSLSSEPSSRFLVIRSEPEEFPADAASEIAESRMVSEGGWHLPPCRVEIVLGVVGRLFVVLPTGVVTTLPFACNGPFLQDPARMKVKDPSTSPTNRWLLDRIGRLAARSALDWLRLEAPLDERAKAYRLFPDVNRDDRSLEGMCATLVEQAMRRELQDTEFVLTEDGKLVGRNACVALPREVLAIWDHDQIGGVLTTGKPVLSDSIGDKARATLLHWRCAEGLEGGHVLRCLTQSGPPKPRTWRRLLRLWNYVSEEVTHHYYGHQYRNVRIVPTRAGEHLAAAGEVVRLGEKRLLDRAEDWDFLSEQILVVDQNWIRFLAKAHRVAEDGHDSALAAQLNRAQKVLESIGLHQPGDASRVVQRAATGFFASRERTVAECVQFAHIAAKLNADVRPGFRFVTRNGSVQPTSFSVIADASGALEAWFPADWYAEHTLHDAYWERFESCSRDEWGLWVASGRAGLLGFAPLRSAVRWMRESDLRELLSERSYLGDVYSPFRSNSYEVCDWDFGDEVWAYWRSLAPEEPRLWAELLATILRQPPAYAADAMSAQATQVSQARTKRTVTSEAVTPAWIMKFRELPCLVDTWGQCRHPAELLRRTPVTEALLDVEPFVRAELDTEANRPLLVALGVRDTPTGPDQLLERLRALSCFGNAPLEEVLKWYRRLDQLFCGCSTEQAARIRDAFRDMPLILTTAAAWVRAGEVFLSPDEAVAPDAHLVHQAASHLQLWVKMGVHERPTAELAIAWLGNLEPGARLGPDQARRVRTLLQRYPERIWAECGCWLNLDGEWVAVDSLEFALTMQALVPSKGLFPAVRARTADFQVLTAELTRRPPFSRLGSLGLELEDRPGDMGGDVAQPQEWPWLHALGRSLTRVEMEDEAAGESLRSLAERLAATEVRVVQRVLAQPFLKGVPAGAPRPLDALWADRVLYVTDVSKVKVAGAVAKEIGRRFERDDISDAVKFCFDRPKEYVLDYMEENFTLRSVAEPGSHVTVEEKVGSGSHEGTDIPPLPGELRPDAQGPGPKEAEPSAPAGGTAPRPRPGKDTEHVAQHRPPFIERWASREGFRADGPQRFVRSDGYQLTKEPTGPAAWGLTTPDGDLVHVYFPREHCLERGPLQLEAEVWHRIEGNPARCSLLLCDRDGGGEVYRGERLKRMIESQELRLLPAAYRLGRS